MTAEFVGGLWSTPDRPISRAEGAVLAALLEHPGRIVGREELARDAGLRHLGPRRTDGALVRLREVLGQDAIVNVRRRGWMIRPEALAKAAALAALIAGTG